MSETTHGKNDDWLFGKMMDSFLGLVALGLLVFLGLYMVSLSIEKSAILGKPGTVVVQQEPKTNDTQVDAEPNGNEPADTSTTGKLKTFANELKLDAAQFSSCLSSNKYKDQIEENYQKGIESGVRGTPSSFINGWMIAGAYPFDLIDNNIITPELEGKLKDNNSITVPGVGDAITKTELNIDLSKAAGVLGDPGAPIKIIEFSDYQCPFCKRFATQAMDQINTKYIKTGKAVLYYFDFPLDQLHPDARTLANAARCAGEQDKYFEMYDKIQNMP